MASIREVQSLASSLSWNTRISRTRLSTVDGLSMSAAPVLTAQGLGHVLQTVQRLGLYRCPFEELKHEAVVGEGESFRVERCRYNKEVVAVKHVKLEESGSNSQSSYHRLQSVLLEIQIMQHGPLKEHPNILPALGYGWKSQGDSMLPYVVVEFAAHGSLRAWLRETSQQVKTKFKIVGDIASGLKALHMCDIIHGDLKLDNIVVVPFPDRVVKVIAKLCDFGHSIILREGSRGFKYFGTILYNAPELELQDTCKIAREALHKCDIWAFGLLVWEIFADGARYFNPSWATDPMFTSQTSLNPPSYSELPRQLSSVASSTLHSSSEDSYVMVTRNNPLNTPASDPGNQHGLGTFDPKHLQKLSLEFVNTLRFPGLTIEKGYLRKLLSNTLQTDPSLRPSQIILLPTMVDWDRSDTGALKGQLAIHTGSSALSFQMFYPDQEYEIPWEYKRQILQNLILLSSNHKSQDEAASSAFQASLCYITGFGTSPIPGSALLFLQRATELKHPMAILFAENLRWALGDETQIPEREHSYTDNIIQGFKNQTPEVRGLELRQLDPVLGQTVERFQSFAAFKLWVDGVDDKDYEKMAGSHVITMPFMIRMDILSLAIAMDDVSTVRKFAKIFLQEKSTSPDDTALIQACRRGNTEIVHALLDAGADPETVTESGCSLYHWLFMLGDGARSVAKRLLNSERNFRSNLLNHPCSRPYMLHPQWPLELVGTPLAFAIISKSTTAVDVLLNLGALPYAPINGSNDKTSKISWTPIHMSVKFHLVDVLHLLLDRMSPSSPFLSVDGTVEISTFELARCLSHSTMVERLAMQGRDVMPALTRTLAALPLTALSSASDDGLTPIMEAIDFSNLDVVKAMLQLAPKLALKPFVDPEDPRLFTYPVLFAAQIAARRDSSLTLEIVKLLLSHMPRKNLVRDSEGQTPLHLSVTGYSTSTTEWLLKNGYSHNIRDNNGRTAIHQARSTASLDTLLAAGADINCADRSGFTCAHLAALQGFEDLIDGLIYRGANLMSVSNIGSPLHCAILKQSWRVASSLLLAKHSVFLGVSRVDVNATDGNGDTAMHLAVKTPAIADFVRLLLSHGASANIRNRDGLTPLHLLIASGDVDSFKAFMLAEKAARESSTWQIKNVTQLDPASAKHLSPNFAERVVKGIFPLIDFNISTDDRRTQFHTAATFASAEIAKILREHGANVSIRDTEGNNAVHLAVFAQEDDIAKNGGDRYRFLDNCFPEDLGAENKRGVRPWDIACQQQNFDLMTYLLRVGGPQACRYKTFLTHHNGRKLLHDAIDANEWSLVDLLLSPKNLSHLSPIEREARSKLLKGIGKGGKISSEKHVQKIFEQWLTASAQNSSSDPIQAKVEALQPGKYSLEEMNRLCAVVNAAADYRALIALDTAADNIPASVFQHVYNSRYSNRISKSILGPRFIMDLNPFHLEQVSADLEELKREGLKRLETILLAHIPSNLATHGQILDLFRGCKLDHLLSLASLTNILTPDRPIDEDVNCRLIEEWGLDDEILGAVSNKDSTVLKKMFPITPNVVVRCCSWAKEMKILDKRVRGSLDAEVRAHLTQSGDTVS